MKENISPCPWCGHTPTEKTVQHSNETDTYPMYYWECENPKCPMQPSTPAYKKKGMHTKVWNTRKFPADS